MFLTEVDSSPSTLFCAICTAKQNYLNIEMQKLKNTENTIKKSSGTTNVLAGTQLKSLNNCTALNFQSDPECREICTTIIKMSQNVAVW